MRFEDMYENNDEPWWKGCDEPAKDEHKIMFDDGRFLASLVAEGESVGLQPVRGASSRAKRLARNASVGIVSDPEESELLTGPAGGGGVRLRPPHLEEALVAFSGSFTVSSQPRSPRDRVTTVVVDGEGGA